MHTYLVATVGRHDLEHLVSVPLRESRLGRVVEQRIIRQETAHVCSDTRNNHTAATRERCASERQTNSLQGAPSRTTEARATPTGPPTRELRDTSEPASSSDRQRRGQQRPREHRRQRHTRRCITCDDLHELARRRREQEVVDDLDDLLGRNLGHGWWWWRGRGRGGGLKLEERGAAEARGRRAEEAAEQQQSNAEAEALRLRSGGEGERGLCCTMRLREQRLPPSFSLLLRWRTERKKDAGPAAYRYRAPWPIS